MRPNQPLLWLQQAVSYAQSQVPAADLTIGLPSYGYTTTTCKKVAHVTSNVAYVTMQHLPGFPSTPTAVQSLETRTRVRSDGVPAASSTTMSIPAPSMRSWPWWKPWG